MKITHYLYIAMLLLLGGCAEELNERPLTQEQATLIGRRIDFRASIADRFSTRTTYARDGSFNENDIMTIYRQYASDDKGSFDAPTSDNQSYRVYVHKTKYATGSSVISLGSDWVPKEGEIGADGTTLIDPQTESDTLTWENGRTVRFRAWSRSNYAGSLEKNSKEVYYPDYCVSEWVTVSGPTHNIALTLKHQGCRIELTAQPGNELYKAEISTDWEDYKRQDNADTKEHDEATTESSKSEADAKEEANLVKAAYDKMCMPAGVDMEHSLLKAITKEKYEKLTEFSTIHKLSDGYVAYGQESAENITNNVQRAIFTSSLNYHLYMITIPYDMSSEHKGEPLVLPACTRFKIWLYDVNKGDGAHNETKEKNYHILSLADIKDANGQPLFPNGLELLPGYSYEFKVGYHYDKFTVTPADNFSWEQQDAEAGNAVDERVSKEPSDKPYQWWKKAITAAIPQTTEESYNPVFHITNETEFLEFINLVNGTAAKNTYQLVHKQVTDPNDPEKKVYRWYKNAGDAVKDSVTHEQTEADGFIFYDHYYPADADNPAYSIEDYVKAPYSFFDEDFNRHFVVYLDRDLDLKDWKLTAIGDAETHPFRGVFDGYDAANNKIYTLKSVYMDGGYLFKYCQDAAIRNVMIETVHDFKLVYEASAKNSSGYGAYIVGISIHAPSDGNPIAAKLTGSSYVVGCFYQGRATGAMVGEADNLNMVGNMMVAEGIASGQGALLGKYADNNKKFFAPQTSKTLTWGNFMVNYYDTTLSPGTNAVGSIADNYKPQQYIRGVESYILKAINDNMLSSDVDYDELTNNYLKKGYYGLAPWRALNYAIWKYNSYGAQVGEAHNCKSHFANDAKGYAHSYPWRVPGEPEDCSAYDVLEQKN